MNQDEYRQGYQTGAGATQDQEAGAREAERERQRREAEQRERDEQTQRLQDELRRDRDARETRDRTAAARAGASRSAGGSGSPSASGSTGAAARKASAATGTGSARDLVTVAGLIGGALLGWAWFPDHGAAIAGCAVLAAFIARALHRLILAGAVLAGGLWLWTLTDREAGEPMVTAAEVVAVPEYPAMAADAVPAPNPALPEPAPAPAAEPEAALESAASAAAAPVAVEAAALSGPDAFLPGLLRLDNACRHPLEVFVEFRRADTGVELLRWDLAGGQRDLVALDGDRRPIPLASGAVLFQARIVGHDTGWDGPETRRAGDRVLAMRALSLDDAGAGYTLSLGCGDDGAPLPMPGSGPFLLPAPAPPA